MDALASQLSMMSFAVIGVICLIGTWRDLLYERLVDWFAGVLQHRSWLEMFTIGGMPRTEVLLLHDPDYPKSVSCRRGNS